MIDRKKVIEILWDWHYRVPGGTDEYDALMDAIALLREPDEKEEQPCHENKQDFSELTPMYPETESEMGMPLDGMGSWWYRCSMCHDPLDYKQKECSWCHLKIDWEGQ